MAQNKLREQVAQAFIDSLNEGDLPWEAAWQTAYPQNAVTGKNYRGLNSLWLSVSASKKGFKDPRWCTFKQAMDKGWSVKKGEKSSLVEFWSLYDKKTRKLVDRKDAQRIIRDEPEREKDFILMSKVYNVFNGEQIEGIPEFQVESNIDIATIRAQRDTLLANMKLDFREGGNQAYYTPAMDRITMPPESLFADTYGYMSTFLHEAGHASGHESRLNRDLTGSFGSEQYAREELRAEIASAFTAQALGFGSLEDSRTADMQNHKAYVKHWISCIESDPNELFAAIRDAEKISDYLLEKGEFVKEREGVLQMEVSKPSLDSRIAEAASVAKKLPEEKGISDYCR